MFDDLSFAPVHIEASVGPVLLPHVPSKLIRLALDDLLKVEQMPEQYRVDMWTFHSEESPTRCAVCTAGSVMAMRLGAELGRHVSVSSYGEHNSDALLFISDCSVTKTSQSAADSCFGIGAKRITFEHDWPSYEQDCAGFHASRRALADAFEASGQ